MFWEWQRRDNSHKKYNDVVKLAKNIKNKDYNVRY